jgi:hypothetical protein
MRVVLSAALAASLCLACSDGGSDPEHTNQPLSELALEGSVAGQVDAERTRAIAVWNVTSGSPDYAFKYGDGSSSGHRFVLSLDGAPPSEAVNAYGVAVGLVVLVPVNVEIPEGKVTEETLQLLGFSTQYAIIWKATASSGEGWMQTFPNGYACGRCKAAPEGSTFDSYERVSCSQFEVERASDDRELQGCNWT